MGRSEQFREAAAIENRGRSKAGWRYSSELKSLAIEHCRAERQAGCSWADLSAQLGVSALTLSRWLDAAPAAGFRPVAVIEDEEPPQVAEDGRLIVTTPGGLRIEGLSWPQALEMARVFL
jgi:hypothetical protein